MVINIIINMSRKKCPVSNTDRHTGSNHVAPEELKSVMGTLSRETIPNGFAAAFELEAGVNNTHMSTVKSNMDMSTMLEYTRPRVLSIVTAVIAHNTASNVLSFHILLPVNLFTTDINVELDWTGVDGWDISGVILSLGITSSGGSGAKYTGNIIIHTTIIII